MIPDSIVTTVSLNHIPNPNCKKQKSKFQSLKCIVNLQAPSAMRMHSRVRDVGASLHVISQPAATPANSNRTLKERRSPHLNLK